MKRRTAIQSMIAVSTGAVLLPACNFFQEPLKVYANLPLDQAQRGMIAQLSKFILPTDDLEGFSTPESTLDFLLTMINDSYQKEDIDKYINGITELPTYLKKQYNTTFDKLQPEQFEEILTNQTVPESIKYFFNTTDQLTKQHFTTSEYYLKNFTDWEFAPGRYEGCVKIN